MSDVIARNWTERGQKKSFHLRAWWYGSFWSMLCQLWKWLFCKQGKYDKYVYTGPVHFHLRTRSRDQDKCYCPTGSTTEFRFDFFGLGFRGWLSRDWTKRPCHCDKIVWLCFPENYEAEIEDYGGIEKLKAEYPGVEAV